jgi:hypothetical protein
MWIWWDVGSNTESILGNTWYGISIKGCCSTVLSFIHSQFSMPGTIFAQASLLVYIAKLLSEK